MHVFVTKVEHHAGAWNSDALSLLALAGRAKPHKHELAGAPEDADLVLITDLRSADFMHSLRAHPLLREFPEKCFVYNRMDLPIGFVRGVYASTPKSRFRSGRFRAGCYLYEVSQWRNPFISELAERDREPDLFFSFVGRRSAACREALLATEWDRSDVVVADPSYDHWDRTTENRALRQRQFADISRRSRFVICPRGTGTSSERLFEVMELGRVPVIISDDWEAPLGPKWEDFSVRIAERDVADLVELLEPFEGRVGEMGRRARQEWLQWFSPEKQFNYIVDACIDIQREARIPEPYMRHAWPFQITHARMRGRRPRALAHRIVKGRLGNPRPPRPD